MRSRGKRLEGRKDWESWINIATGRKERGGGAVSPSGSLSLFRAGGENRGKQRDPVLHLP